MQAEKPPPVELTLEPRDTENATVGAAEVEARSRRAGWIRRSVVDRGVGRRVVHVIVLDRALALPVADGRPGDVGDVDEERLVGLDAVSPLTVTLKVYGRAACGIVWPVSDSRDVIVVLGCRIVVLRRAVGGGDVEGHAARPAGAVRLTVKVKVVVPGVALGASDVADGQVRQGHPPCGVTE